MTRKRVNFPARPTPNTGRESWQIEQAARCGCKGTDDMCPCQNENPWPRQRRDYEAEVRTLELQQQTDRQTIASIRKALEASQVDRDDLTDIISDAISDSLDMDWTSTDGARAVVKALVKEGIVTLLPESNAPA